MSALTHCFRHCINIYGLVTACRLFPHCHCETRRPGRTGSRTAVGLPVTLMWKWLDTRSPHGLPLWAARAALSAVTQELSALLPSVSLPLITYIANHWSTLQLSFSSDWKVAWLVRVLCLWEITGSNPSISRVISPLGPSARPLIPLPVTLGDVWSCFLLERKKEKKCM